MAKAKKASTDTEPKAPKAAPKKAAKASAKPAPATGTPLINTDLAAANAARMLMASTKKTSEQPVSRSSGLIGQLKAGLNKPAGSSMASLLDKTAGPGARQSNAGHGGPQKQLGRNQTFGADANRSYVPRRTGGG